MRHIWATLFGISATATEIVGIGALHDMTLQSWSVFFGSLALSSLLMAAAWRQEAK